ncbi:hypothetical protein O181_058417 [Austropuccinia psidii MF-1]|uniref:DUF4939 domain-containing protein n=1 Tax=Austropuccinia psidii MF-1 TaxID=1389203 RepID=A0A9Q3EJQ4_9BASI|nr:hypothetical protein [Austropuccinia psidii MF-1]
MFVKHSPPVRQTRSQDVLTPTPRAPLESTTAVPQLRAQLDREPILEARKRANEIKSIFRSSAGGPTLAQSNQPVSHQSESSLLTIMQKMTQIMANHQAASSSEALRPPVFKNPSMKEPECFNGTHPFKFRSFIQYCKLIFHNDQENFSQERKKALYSTSFLIGRDEKWIEPHLSHLTNQDPNYLLN